MAGTAEVSDPRVARTRRDVVAAAAEVLLADGWEHVTHAEIARRSGYARGTIYTYWPQRLDLVRDAVDLICDEAHHPQPTGDLRADLLVALEDFAADLSTGRLARILGGVIERTGSDPVVDQLRRRLYDTGTAGLRRALEVHLSPGDVDVPLAVMTGAVLVRVAFDAQSASRPFLSDVVDRALAGVARPEESPTR
ncbi:TetR/AcrR family transcriptional regulator [Salinibacterium soli]|uniref:TetR family transcriptional regulator n=1 Tax=Antiquaquibacter soli TaxID=3064523 RepID=A0ABT9BPZ0_9MICO|nr:TetR/AcrR family transcriptional regulator [Protaetiibacter sp. WY-16]MDO7881861.1 TetR family transcriptional regulator [Protaetiibacter sp. WY-16]